MPRIKVWQPLAQNDLPATLRLALQAANNQSRRNWAVCQQVVLEVPEVSHAELLRLKEQVRVLESQLKRRREPKIMPDLFGVVKDLISRGQVITCSKEEYPHYREALHKVAAWAIDNGQTVCHNIALNEVRRLDKLHGFVVREGA